MCNADEKMRLVLLVQACGMSSVVAALADYAGELAAKYETGPRYNTWRATEGVLGQTADRITRSGL